MASTVFPAASAGFDPTKVSLQQTLTATGNVTIPAGVNQVYAIAVGGGGGGGGGGGASGGSTRAGGGGSGTDGCKRPIAATPCVASLAAGGGFVALCLRG
jgi:hypothetical protein